MTKIQKLEQLAAESPDQRQELLQRLKAAAPEAFVEGKLDLDALKSLLGESVEAGQERFTFSWAGKRGAIAMLQAPTRSTLVPDTAASVDFEAAQHVFIEGENLEVLKVLYRSYHGRIKLIYIDPPYNTGEDFVYPDNFNDPLDHYMRLTGQKSGEGDYGSTKTDKAGRFHSSWLSMMYPRLSLARQLLKENGIILVSIDDHEVVNLRRLMDEVFGEENFIGQMIWEKGRKNDAKLLSAGHEYILIYAKSLATLKAEKTVWREEKPGAKEIWDEYLRLRAIHGEDDGKIESDLSRWYSDLPKSHPSKKWSRYKRIDKNGPWRDDNISWPGSGGPRYDVIHPKTGKPCVVPEAGWRFSDPEAMERQIKLGVVTFRADHSEPPFRKTYLRPPAEILLNGNTIDDEESDENAEGEDGELATMVRGTYFYKQSQVTVKHLRKLMGAKVFDNPKDHEELARLFKYICGGEEKPLVVDFFAGSASSAEAVIRLAANGNPDMRFVAVQMAQACDPKDKTGKAALSAGYKTIADIARDRVRRVLKLGEFKGRQGFRAFHIAPSHITPWKGLDEKTPEGLAKQLEVFQDTLVQGWKPEGVVWEAAIREGYSLTAKLEAFTGSKGGTFWRVTDIEKNQSFTINLDEGITLEAVRALDLKKEDLFICRATALTDTLAANLALQCRLKVL
jgi:adenine-specific DNA-methyltransferase